MERVASNFFETTRFQLSVIPGPRKRNPGSITADGAG